MKTVKDKLNFNEFATVTAILHDGKFYETSKRQAAKMGIATKKFGIQDITEDGLVIHKGKQYQLIPIADQLKHGESVAETKVNEPTEPVGLSFNVGVVIVERKLSANERVAIRTHEKLVEGYISTEKFYNTIVEEELVDLISDFESGRSESLKLFTRVPKDFIIDIEHLKYLIEGNFTNYEFGKEEKGEQLRIYSSIGLASYSNYIVGRLVKRKEC